MTKMDEFNHWGTTEVFWFPCEAGCDEYISVMWDDDDPEYRFIDINAWYCPRGWKRFRYMWRILWGKPVYNNSVLLNDVAIRGLKEVLNKYE